MIESLNERLMGSMPSSADTEEMNDILRTLKI